MLEFLKKAAGPILKGTAIILGLGAAAIFSDPRNWRNGFSFTVKPPVGPPFRDPDFFKNAPDENGKIVLHADELQQLRWMTVSQLKAIFNGRRGQFVVESSPAAYQELRWMSTAQIEAIFGTKTP